MADPLELVIAVVVMDERQGRHPVKNVIGNVG
jgi:hypothetical protein